MIPIKAYYAVRSYIPKNWRVALRRRHAKHIATLSHDCWPIQERAGRRPADWKGWPDGKQFGVVLTHDVEGRSGLERVKALAELEMRLGFRSLFNFVPEGEYSVSKDLREYLIKNGFEVGVHDLHHDGKLFSSAKSYGSKATRINSYLKEWGACGFRSAFMLRKLNWLHALDIKYDLSTFDTDPFEPQPGGIETIFPFRITGTFPKLEGDPDSNENSFPHSHIELPYTLAQDSTIYLFLEEKTNAIWVRKLDWIAQKGGMVLLNVHPDYINLDGSAKGFTYPADHYIQFLKYIRSRYDGAYWHGLPKTIATHYEASLPPIPSNKRSRKICMLAATHYGTDARVARYARTLAERGDQVEVIACANRGTPSYEAIYDGVFLYEISRANEDLKRGPLSHLMLLLVFFFRSFAFLRRQHREQPYDLIHVHNIPEWLVFAALPQKLSGTKILLDIHDLVPELFHAKFAFARGKSSFLGPLLCFVERMSCSFSDHVIISNHLWKNRLVQRSVPESKCSVFINNIDLNVFYPRPRTRTDLRKIIIFHGSLQWHQGLDIAIRAFQGLSRKVPNAEFHIYGCGAEKKALLELIHELGLEDKVLFFPLVPATEIAAIIANTDLGVVPKRVNSFGNEAYSTKIMEFMSQGVPVVLSRTAVDSYYYAEDEVRFCESDNVEEFTAAMIEVLTNEQVRRSMIQKANNYVQRHHWGSKRLEYLNLVDSLINSGHERFLLQTPETI